jgi:hypothetical protein
MASKNNGIWEIHATDYDQSGREMFYLTYRLAHLEDLGLLNDGSFHHYHVQTSLAQGMGMGKRQSRKGTYGAGRRLHMVGQVK